MEGQERFGREKYLLVAGEGAASRPRATPGQCADQRAFATAGKSADGRPNAPPPPAIFRRAFAFAFFNTVNGASGYRIATPLGMHSLKADLKQRTAL